VKKLVLLTGGTLVILFSLILGLVVFGSSCTDKKITGVVTVTSTNKASHASTTTTLTSATTSTSAVSTNTTTLSTHAWSSTLNSTTQIGTIPVTQSTTIVSSAAVEAKLLFIAIRPQSPVNIGIFTTQQMQAIGRYSDGSNVDITNKVIWNSSNTSVVTVSSTGVVKGTGVGGSNISASLNDIISTPPVTVYSK
jgi:trimeric autotransporter adhesin